MPDHRRNRLLVLDPAAFQAQFGRRPFKLEHRLAGHPLFALPRLVELGRKLAPATGVGSVLYFRADHQINQVEGPGRRTFVARDLARPALSVQDTIAQIESCNAWMQLRNVGLDAEYAGLLADLMSEFRPCAEPLAPGITGVRGDIFVSSPGATTPFHLDEEHNFLLQVRGRKELSIADGSNRAVLGEAQLADFYRGSGELVPYAPQLERVSEHVLLGPGEGVHIPPCHPHWVKNGDEVSISLGVLWFSDVTARQRHLFRVNRGLERVGLRPRPAGAVPLLDALKVAPFQARRRAVRALAACRRALGRGRLDGR
jgi:hypothetical protein